jgi:SAM-dependent methyltransferase
VSAISALIRPDRYPLSSRYDPRWVIALEMGPHPLWQLEDILPALALEPGSRVRDLGCGRGATSVFLARECGVTVTACDLWVRVEELARVFRKAGVERSVTAVNADVRRLPFADDAFDAIVRILRNRCSSPTHAASCPEIGWDNWDDHAAQLEGERRLAAAGEFRVSCFSQIRESGRPGSRASSWPANRRRTIALSARSSTTFADFLLKTLSGCAGGTSTIWQPCFTASPPPAAPSRS